jgi:hypothetical protein
MKKKTKNLADWRGKAMSRIRTLIKQADPEMVEEVKWRKPSNPAGIPVWYHDGMICTGETYKNHLRLTFAKGSSLKNPKGLINSYRSMLIHEGDKINEAAFKNLIRAAVALNRTGKNRQQLKPAEIRTERRK